MCYVLYFDWNAHKLFSNYLIANDSELFVVSVECPCNIGLVIWFCNFEATRKPTDSEASEKESVGLSLIVNPGWVAQNQG